MATSKKKTKKVGAKKTKKSARKRDGKGIIASFMVAMVQAGALGPKIPAEKSEQNEKAKVIRQMAESLARQTRKFGEGDLVVGGGADSGEDDGGEDGEE